MDGILVLLWAIGGFVVLCCACSFWQAYKMQVEIAHFDSLHSKYSKENIERVKEKRKRTAQEILELKEEIRIAEERLLAEHQYEQKLLSRLQQKELRPNLKRRKNRKNKPWPPRRRPTKAPRLVLEDSDSDDIEELISSKDNYEHDIEKGRSHSQQIRKRNFINKRKDENVIERVYQWLTEPSPRKRRMSGASPGKKFSPRVSIKMPKLDWTPFKKRKVNPIPKYITEQQIIEKEPDFYQPKFQTEVRKISLSPPVAKHSTPAQTLSLAVKSPSERSRELTPQKVPRLNIQEKSLVTAWESPVSNEADSVGLGFESPKSNLTRQKLKVPRLKKLPLTKVNSDFSSKASIDADTGLYGHQVDDNVFNPEHEIDFDDYSDL